MSLPLLPPFYRLLCMSLQPCLSRLKMRPLCWPQRKTAVLPARVPRPIWKILFGSVRSKTAVAWIHPARA